MRVSYTLPVLLAATELLYTRRYLSRCPEQHAHLHGVTCLEHSENRAWVQCETAIAKCGHARVG